MLFLICFLCISLNVKHVSAASVPKAVRITKISAPAQKRVTLTWNKVKQATGYVIYYKKSNVQKWTKLDRVSSSTYSFTHTSSKAYPILIGQKYDYCVRAYDKKTKTYSAIGKYSSRTVRTLPDAVPMKSVAMNSAKTGVVVRWAKTAGASGYVIMRRTSGGWIRIATVDNTCFSYTDQYFDSGKTNYYTVAAYNNRAKTIGKYDYDGLSIFIKKTGTSLKKLRVLFIGNSHTYMNDLPMFVSNYAKKNGYDMECVMIAHCGRSLAEHAKEKDVRFNILYGNFDYVILQDHAANFDATNFLSAIKTFDSWISQTNSKTVLFLPWTRKTRENKQPAMTSTYEAGADMIGAILVPVGKLWWKYIHEHPDAELYDTDGHHASAEGTDFAAKYIWKYLYADLQ